MTTMNTEPSEREERLKQIRERQPSREQFLYGQDIDFLLSLLDSQATTKPTGWISCGLRQGRDDRIVDIVFENAECAKAFIDGVEPAVGPIVAATRMRERCVSAVKELRDDWWRRAGIGPTNEFTRKRIRADAADDIITALESLTLDGKKEQ